MTNKNCSKCGINFPATKEFFIASKHCKLGLSNVCKICSNIQKREWLIKNGHNFKQPLKPPTLPKPQKDKEIWKVSQNLRQGIITRSKKKNVPCNKELLTADYFYNILINNKSCECCHKYFIFTNTINNHELSPTVDRIIPNLGYLENNIALICWKCNVIKNNASLQVLKNLLAWMKTL